jgi:hypothetical protein
MISFKKIEAGTNILDRPVKKLGQSIFHDRCQALVTGQAIFKLNF